MEWWDTQAFAAVGGAVAGAVVTGVFLTIQARQIASGAAAERRERRAEQRVERVRVATSDLTDALSAALSEYDAVVQSAREEAPSGGQTEFAPALTKIDATVRPQLLKAWARYQIATGLQLPGRQNVSRVIRRLDLMIEDGTVPVFDADSRYIGEDVATLSGAYRMLGELRAEIDSVFAATQANVQRLEHALERLDGEAGRPEEA